MTDAPRATLVRPGEDLVADVPHVGTRLADLRERLTWADAVLLCLDFDGTLAPIVADPDEAEPLPSSRRALAAVTDCPAVDVAIVSGRALDDVRRRVGVDGIHYAGNHGLELERGDDRTVHPDAAAARPALAAALDEVRTAIGDVPGLRLEDKAVTATVHYRRSPPDRTPAIRSAVAAAVEERPALRLTEGKQVLELRPDVAADKGTAVRTLLDDRDGPLPVYVGDDETDEAAFRAVDPVGVGVHVGDAGDTAATYRIADPGEVAALLRWFATEGAALLAREA